MNPNYSGGNYPGNRPLDGAQGRPLSDTRGTGPGYSPYPQGAPAPYGHQMPPPYPYMQLKPFSTKAIVAMVMGGVSVLFWPVAPLTGIAGVVLGFLGMRESKEPQGTHRGWGLALGGLITSAVMLLVAVAIFGLFIFVFTQVENDRTRYQDTSNVRSDLNLIRERLQLYAIENGNSLEPGGPVVRDGWSSSYGEDSEKVTGRLELTDLVSEMELDRMLSEYTLEVTGRRSATVRNKVTGTSMVISDVVNNQYTIQDRSTR